MYKKQLTVQKVVCMLCIIFAAITFLYSLGIMTDLYDALYFTMWDPEDPSDTKVPGSEIFYNMQDFNRAYVNMSIVFILTACLLFLTNTHSRRRYYIGNYVSIGIFSAGSLALSVWSHLEIEAYKAQFQKIDFEALKVFAEERGTLYMDINDTFLFDLHYLVAGLCILAVVLLVANMIWKIQLMRSERQLIEAGKEAAV